jgi:hypothetical protein
MLLQFKFNIIYNFNLNSIFKISKNELIKLYYKIIMTFICHNCESGFDKLSCGSSCEYANCCILCKECNCVDPDFKETFERCIFCDFVYSTKCCSCAYCNGCYITHDNRACENCYPYLNVGKCDFCAEGCSLCVDMFLTSIEKDVIFCQVCHKFIFNDEKDHKNHTTIKKKKSLVQIAKLKYPQIKRYLCLKSLIFD